MIGKVPMWFWELKARRYGARLPKRTLRAPKTWTAETTVKSFPVLIGGVSSPIGPRIVQGKRARRRDARGYALNPHDPMLFQGNLDMPEYLFWVGSETKSGSFAKCRVCFKPTYTQEDRKKHLRRDREDGSTLSCASKAQIIAKLLSRGEKLLCVECDKETKDMRWGLPICGNEKCLKRFMFSLATANAWMYAKRKAEAENWVK